MFVGLILFAIFATAAVVSLRAGLRSKLRVRRMLTEAATEAARCTVEGEPAQRFFTETQLLRSALEDCIDNPDNPVLLQDELDLRNQRIAAFARTMNDWIAAYPGDPDAPVRLALEARGVTPARLQLFEAAHPHIGATQLRRLLEEARDIERRLAAPVRLTAYR